MISKTMGFKVTRGSILLKALYYRHNKITAKNLNIQSTAKTLKKISDAEIYLVAHDTGINKNTITFVIVFLILKV